LHVLSVSVPHVNGYTIRSKYLVDAQRRAGYDPIVVTSARSRPHEPPRLDAVVDGTPYLRVGPPRDASGWSPAGILDAGWSRWTAFRRFKALQAVSRTPAWSPRQVLKDYRWAARDDLLRRQFERGLDGVVERLRPDVIHAHSPYRCGVPALGVARRHGIPLVYEVRGVWEESRAGKEGDWVRESREYQWRREAESVVMTRADAVVCISEQLRREIVARGVPAARVVVVPNAADPSVFHPPSALTVEAHDEIAEVRRRLRGLTLGYAGSLRKIQGVDELVRGAAELVRRGRDVSLLVVGGGDCLEELKTLARRLGIGERAVFTGLIPHDRVPFHYALMDVFVISRPRLPVNNLVTPLKPLEAMAMERPSVMSDLPALRELGIEGETGFFYTPGDVSGLADACARLLDDAALRRRLGERARGWVLENRTWPAVLRTLYAAYERLAGQPAATAAADRASPSTPGRK
jgi:glycosyltransferase involved in cell wall biosynthesis